MTTLSLGDARVITVVRSDIGLPGPPGPAGPGAPSVDTGNLLSVGSDELLLLTAAAVVAALASRLLPDATSLPAGAMLQVVDGEWRTI